MTPTEAFLLVVVIVMALFIINVTPER